MEKGSSPWVVVVVVGSAVAPKSFLGASACFFILPPLSLSSARCQGHHRVALFGIARRPVSEGGGEHGSNGGFFSLVDIDLRARGAYGTGQPSPPHKAPRRWQRAAAVPLRRAGVQAGFLFRILDPVLKSGARSLSERERERDREGGGKKREGGREREKGAARTSSDQKKSVALNSKADRPAGEERERGRERARENSPPVQVFSLLFRALESARRLDLDLVIKSRLGCVHAYGVAPPLWVPPSDGIPDQPFLINLLISSFPGRLPPSGSYGPEAVRVGCFS